jgi:hypothetical protein
MIGHVGCRHSVAFGENFTALQGVGSQGSSTTPWHPVPS